MKPALKLNVTPKHLFLLCLKLVKSRGTKPRAIDLDGLGNLDFV